MYFPRSNRWRDSFFLFKIFIEGVNLLSFLLGHSNWPDYILGFFDFTFHIVPKTLFLSAASFGWDVNDVLKVLLAGRLFTFLLRLFMLVRGGILKDGIYLRDDLFIVKAFDHNIRFSHELYSDLWQL